MLYWCYGNNRLKIASAGSAGAAGGRLPGQAARGAGAVVDRCPDQLKLPYWLWTREAVGDLIARRYGVRLSVWTVGRMLRRGGFTPRKPGRRSFEQNSEE